MICDRRAEFARMYSELGLKWDDISAKLGVAKSVLIRWRAQMGLKTRTDGRQARLDALRPEFERLYRETPMGARAIARKLGISIVTAKWWRRSMGLPQKPKENAQISMRLNPVPRVPRERNHEREFANAWWEECRREQKALAAIDACWRDPRKTYFTDLAASRAYGAAAARRRHTRLKHTPEWKIRVAARNAIARIARMVGSRRKPKTRTFEFLGCDYVFARAYLTARLLPGMTWENHGTVWEIDHVIPLSSFDLTSERQRKKALHFTNLQPLFRRDNREKSAKVTRQQTLAI